VPQLPSSQPKDETLADHDRAGLETVIARVGPAGIDAAVTITTSYELMQPAPWRASPPVSDALWARVNEVRAMRAKVAGRRRSRHVHLLAKLMWRPPAQPSDPSPARRDPDRRPDAVAHPRRRRQVDPRVDGPTPDAARA
jgi:hypothetical protein